MGQKRCLAGSNLLKNTLITAFRIETGSDKKKWFTFQYEFDDEQQLELVR